MNRLPNVIYVRQRGTSYDAFGKALGEGFIITRPTRTEVIFAASQILWAINRFGPEHYQDFQPLDQHPDMPTSFAYPVVIDEL